MDDQQGQPHGPRIDDHEARIASLETKTWVTRLSGAATTIALFLGVLLSASSLYNALVTGPEASRIAQIAQFNAAVNSAAKTAQDMQLFQLQNSDPRAQLMEMSMSIPQIDSDIATAEVLLPDLQPRDVGIPQLTILIDSAFVTGDSLTAKRLVDFAMSKTDVSPYLRSEAERYQGRYFFKTGDPADGHQSYMMAIGNQINPAQKAFDLSEATGFEFAGGDCDDAMADLQSFVNLLDLPGFPAQQRTQLLASEKQYLQNAENSQCPVSDAEAMLPDQ
jgi:hypothetical protein